MKLATLFTTYLQIYKNGIYYEIYNNIYREICNKIKNEFYKKTYNYPERLRKSI